jgi:hypothetical protein
LNLPNKILFLNARNLVLEGPVLSSFAWSVWSSRRSPPPETKTRTTILKEDHDKPKNKTFDRLADLEALAALWSKMKEVSSAPMHLLDSLYLDEECIEFLIDRLKQVRPQHRPAKIIFPSQMDRDAADQLPHLIELCKASLKDICISSRKRENFLRSEHANNRVHHGKGAKFISCANLQDLRLNSCGLNSWSEQSLFAALDLNPNFLFVQLAAPLGELEAEQTWVDSLQRIKKLRSKLVTTYVHVFHLICFVFKMNWIKLLFVEDMLFFILSFFFFTVIGYWWIKILQTLSWSQQKSRTNNRRMHCC